MIHQSFKESLKAETKVKGNLRAEQIVATGQMMYRLYMDGRPQNYI
jgi:hypothetical protein